MFNIGMGELFVIVLLVLVVVGPERLPAIMRQIGKYTYQLRVIINEITDQFADELRPIQEIQQLADDLNPVKQVTKVSMSLVEPPKKNVNSTTTATQPPAAGPHLVKPASRPAVKPTAVFHTPPPKRGNPMKVIGQTQRPSASPAQDANDTDTAS